MGSRTVFSGGKSSNVPPILPPVHQVREWRFPAEPDGFRCLSVVHKWGEGARIAYLSVGNDQRRRMELSTVLRIFQSDAD